MERKRVGLGIVAVILAWVWFQSHRVEEMKAPAPPLKYGWVKRADQTVAIYAGQKYQWGLKIPRGADPRVRYVVQATQPVYLAAGPGPDLSAGVNCQQSNVLSTEQVCSLSQPEDSLFMVQDQRDPNAVLGPAAAAALGIKKPFEEQVAQNRIKVELYTWGCVENCSGNGK